ncbi:MAG: protein kinase, partial [Planctomycetaceae bacterium]|nr:protein kinase [Planctomycetaceae bacterium]
MPSANCFDAPTLKDYLLGKLSDEQSDVVAAHLEACLSCEATVSQLDRASDTLTNGLRLPAIAAEPQTDDELQKALNKVQSLEALANHQTSEGSVSTDRSPVLRDYRLLEPLGSGGMGQVFKAVHTRLDRLVAVKLLPARRLGDDQAVARFQREMRVIGQLSHPAIVQATDAGEVDGTHFLVMEYVEGCDLNTLAKVCGPLSVADACEITRQAALGLEYAHQQGIVHRDIKPSNLMLSRAPNISLKILDLGLALLSGVQAPVDELTTVGQLMGTLDYMAPEQLEDSHLVGPRADIYALAATLYRLLTGFAPFANENRKTPLQKLRALATQAAPPIRERRADLPLDLATIIDRALSRDPAERFVSMNEFATAIAPSCAGHDLSQLVGHVSNVPAPLVELPSLRHQPRSHIRQNVGEPPNGPRSGERGYGIKDTPIARSEHVENVPHGSPPRRTLLITLAVLFLAALGIVITIETNKGTLIVESLRDGIEVRVKKSGKTVEQLELTTGPKSARLAAGEYEIEILGDADGLQIQNGKFVLKRGDTVVAKVTEIPKGQTVATKPELKEPELPAEPQPRKPTEIVDRNAKGMETFEASNPDLAAEKKVRDVLLKNTSAAFQDAQLTDVLRFLEDQTQTVYFLEIEALIEDGIASDTPITLSLADKPTTTILEFLLRPIQLAWYIDGGQVVVTTAAKAKEVLVTRTYPVGKMLPGVRQAVERLKSEPLQSGQVQGGFGGGSGGGFFQVSSTSPLVGTVPAILAQFGGGAAPASNPPQDQPAVIPTEASHLRDLLSESLGHVWLERDGEGGTCELLHNVLVVRNTRPAQADVESLLRTVEAAFLKPLTEPVEIRPAGYSLEADANVRRQLTRKFDAAFTVTPLTDVAEWLSDQLEVPVMLDRIAFTEEGIATDAPVTLQFQGIPGDVLLSRLLKPLQLAYVIEHGLLVFTTAAKEKERLITKVYDVRDLLARGLHPNDPIRGLETTTSGPWQTRDGEGGTITLFADTLLVIRQTSHNHDEVAKFLASLRSQLGDQPEVPRVIKTRPKTPLAAQPNQPTPNEPKPTTPAPAKPTADNQPRYDGKT